MISARTVVAWPDGVAEGTSPASITWYQPPLQSRSPAPADVPALLEPVGAQLIRRTERPVVEGDEDRDAVRAFLALLIDEDGDECEAFLLERATASGDPQAVTARWLAPAARLVGDYWRMDICDFMKVTIVMGRIQRLFWQLVALYPPTTRTRPGCTALLTPLPPEQHGFGLAVVEDALRRSGWEVDRCGVDEEEAYFDLLATNRYSVIGISVSGTAIARSLEAFIQKTRRKSASRSVKVMLGGPVFLDQPELVRSSGADFMAADAASAVYVAESALASLQRPC